MTNLLKKKAECMICNEQIWECAAIVPQCCQSKVDAPNVLCSECCEQCDSCPLCRSNRGLSANYYEDIVQGYLEQVEETVKQMPNLFHLWHQHCKEDIIEDPAYFKDSFLIHNWSNYTDYQEMCENAWNGILEANGFENFETLRHH